MHSRFRFPRLSILLMGMSLVGVMLAIEQAHRFTLALSDGITFAPLWATFPRIFLLLLGLMLSPAHWGMAFSSPYGGLACIVSRMPRPGLTGNELNAKAVILV